MTSIRPPARQMLDAIDDFECGCACGGLCGEGQCCWLCTDRQAETCCMTSGVTSLIVVPPICIIALVVRPWLGLASFWGVVNLVAALAAIAMVNWSYWRVVTSDPGFVRPGDCPTAVSASGVPRVCNKCNAPKPLRAHHCSTCKRCLHSLDHHCPFVANCVALRNRRFFVQFLAWAVVGLAWANAVLGARVLALRDAAEPLDTVASAVLVLGGVILLPLLLALVGLLGFHINLLLTDMTTLDQNQWESRQEAEKRHYANGGEPLVVPAGFIVAPVTQPSKLGWKHNWLLHCGAAPLLWFLPLHDEISSGRVLARGETAAASADDGSGSEAAPQAPQRTGNRLPHQVV